jgi:hypothetical protein
MGKEDAMKRLATALVIALLLLLPAAAYADAATDAALALGSFAVFNQIISGTGLFAGLAAAPPPVYYAPPRPVYVAPPPPVYYAPRPVYVAPRPVIVHRHVVHKHVVHQHHVVKHRDHGGRWPRHRR